MKSIAVLACLVAAASVLPAHAEQGNLRMYKCIDGAGKVYYSDKMNPDCGQGSELNRQGVVMKKKEAAKTAQPSKGEPAATAATATRQEKEQARRDRALMATYTSEDEIDAARDRSLAIPAQGTKAIESKLEKVNLQLTEWKKQADTLAAQKKALPPHLLDDVAATQRDIATLEAELAQRKVQSDSIRSKYEADKQRFRELKGATQTTSK